MRINILQVSDNLAQVVPTAECFQIKEFVALFDRDDTEFKRLAAAELSYVYHMNDWDSPYYKYEETLREEKIIEDFLPTGWTPDAVVQDACIQYRELCKSEFVLLLDSAEVGLHKLRSYFDDVNLLLTDEKGKPIFSSRDLISNLGALGKVTQSLMDLKDQVASYEGQTSRNKRGVTTNKFSE